MKGVTIKDATKNDFKEIFNHRKEFGIATPTQNTHTLVARSSTGTLLGFLELAYTREKSIEIKRLAVREKYKRIGIARKLTGVARSIAIKEKKQIKVYSRREPDAQNFWKIKQGFKTIPEKDNYSILEELSLKPTSIKRKKNSILKKSIARLGLRKR
ncbi:MAG: GNAT family N-acetyltransferase [Candidatus ainarchaeum sp.]|nr:GNAT family N-acetyltransferase [Candidatus ainarchaeum sp.]